MLERFRGVRKTWDVVSMCNGILCGLVSITAGTATVQPWAAIIAGFVSGIIYRIASRLLIRFRVDDPLDAFPVHGACGTWGLIMASMLTTPYYEDAYAGQPPRAGLFYGEGHLIGATRGSPSGLSANAKSARAVVLCISAVPTPVVLWNGRRYSEGRLSLGL